MRVVVQRVKSASVTVSEKVISSIGPGLCLLVGLSRNDTDEDIKWM
jgi:D-tyrosyl-tRNA(Tyr) deacylase